MGNSKSRVTPVRLDEGKAETGVIASLSNRIKELEEEIKTKDEAENRTQEKLTTTELQVEALGVEITKLQEGLSARVSCKSCSALEHMVRKLEEELSIAKNEIEQMETCHERHLQRVRSLSAKSQAESALSLYELRDENQRLTQENVKLLEQIRQNPANGSCGHMELIVELSQRLNSQETELKEAREMLRQLKGNKEE